MLFKRITRSILRCADLQHDAAVARDEGARAVVGRCRLKHKHIGRIFEREAEARVSVGRPTRQRALGPSRPLTPGSRSPTLRHVNWRGNKRNSLRHLAVFTRFRHFAACNFFLISCRWWRGYRGYIRFIGYLFAWGAGNDARGMQIL